MVSATPTPKHIPTDTWVRIAWADYAALVNNPAYDQARWLFLVWKEQEVQPRGGLRKEPTRVQQGY